MAPGRPQDSSAQHLNVIEHAVLSWYPNQPAFLRSIAFVVFLFLLAYGVLHSIGGDFIVRGQLVQQIADGTNVAAKAFDIHLLTATDRYYGTNHKGTYYAVLSMTEYARLLLTGSMTAALSADGDREYPEQLLHFRRLDQTFAPVVLGPLSSPPPAHTQFRKPSEMVLFDTVHAAGGPGTTRIVISELRLGADLSRVEEGTLRLTVNGQNFEALNRRGRAPAGPLPTAPGGRFNYGRDY